MTKVNLVHLLVVRDKPDNPLLTRVTIILFLIRPVTTLQTLDIA
jgi:hypothetical protein